MAYVVKGTRKSYIEVYLGENICVKVDFLDKKIVVDAPKEILIKVEKAISPFHTSAKPSLEWQRHESDDNH